MNSKDFIIRPNSKVEFQSAEDMMEYQRKLVVECLKKIRYIPRIVQQEGEFPYNINANEAVKELTDLQAFFVNLTAHQWVQGIAELLTELSAKNHDAELGDFIKQKFNHFNNVLKILTENISILENGYDKK